MTATRALPLHGLHDEDRADNALGWFASSVVRRAFQLAFEARSALFAVGRVARGTVVRAEYAFVLCEEPEPGWPVISSPKLNAMLGDGRSQTVVTRAIRDLYACDAVDLGHEEGGAFYRAFARYARDPRPADSPFASAFAPVALFTRVVYEPDAWEARLSNFGLKPTSLATVLSPECVPALARPTSDDPRDLYDPRTLIDRIESGREVEYVLRRANELRALVEAHRAAPTADTLRALRNALGLRDPVAQP
jgi:hypothetical protein